MAGIFLSYRRADTLAWAGRLFSDFRKSFGASQVFMDINGGIPRGANFQQELGKALAECDVLLALIGPVWASCTVPDGSSRRLEVADDWVRTEIATALRRAIPVVPVMFGGASLAATDLPDELHGLLAPQRAEVTDSRWDFDVGALLRDLLRWGPLKSLYDMASADAGIGLLRDLIAQVPAVANAVSLSREVIDNTYRQVSRLERFKTLHDALHTIEFECLRPLQAAGPGVRLRPFKIRFAGEARKIEAAAQGNEMSPLLREDLLDHLDLTATAFEAALETGEVGQVMSRLDLMLSSLAPQLDLEISNASTNLELDRLVQLMTKVRATLPAAVLGAGGGLEELAQGIDALDRLRGGLATRVTEHHLLQRLDSKLRSLCVGGWVPGSLVGEWRRIQQIRSRLAPPFSPELEAVREDLAALEREVDETVGRGDEAGAADLVREYFRAVSSVFRDVDSSLKEFCLRLSAVSQPLKTILELEHVMERAAMSPADPFESASELREAQGKLLEALDGLLDEDAPESEAAALTALAPEIRSFLARGKATGAFLEEVKERTACQVLLDYWVSSLAQAGISEGTARLAAFDRDQLPDLADKPCPYVGLEAFRDRDATYFFGRETDIRNLLAQLEETPLLVVLGASGSGKSSLVLGGVLPALARGESPLALRVAPPLVPGNAALEHLADAVLQLGGGPGDDLATEAAKLRQDPPRLAELAGGASAPSTLLTIDQFEEVFTLSEPDREAFAANLAGFLQAGRSHRVILTMREEFRSRMVELRALEGALAHAWFSMRPMGYEELKAAVERPAAMANLQFQSGIVDDLVKKVLGQPAALPLLQFTLRSLWEKRDRNRITWEVYHRVGDPLNALKASADRFYDSLAPQTQDEVRRILLELVRVDEVLEAYRQPVPEQRLLEAGRANTREVLALLAENDYVRISPGKSGGDAVVEVKHESLVRNWPRFVDWIDQKRRERRLRLALFEAAKRWKKTGEGLLTGWQLHDAKEQTDLSPLEQELMEASANAADALERQEEAELRQAAERATALALQERRVRIRALSALVILFLFAVAGAYYFWTENQSLRSKAAQLEREKAQLVQKRDDLLKDYAQLQKSYAEQDENFAKRLQKGVETVRSIQASRPVTLFLHISQEWQRPRAEEIARQLRRQDITVPGIEKVKPVQQSSVRYFHDEDLPGARQIATLLSDYLGGDVLTRPTKINGYENREPLGRYELWFASEALGPKITTLNIEMMPLR